MKRAQPVAASDGLTFKVGDNRQACRKLGSGTRNELFRPAFTLCSPGKSEADSEQLVLSLPYRAFDKDQRVTRTAIVENKRVGEVLAYIKERQDEMLPPKVKTNSEKSGYVKRGWGPIRDGTARHPVFTAPSPVPPERIQTAVL